MTEIQVTLCLDEAGESDAETIDATPALSAAT